MQKAVHHTVTLLEKFLLWVCLFGAFAGVRKNTQKLKPQQRIPQGVQHRALNDCKQMVSGSISL